MLVADVLKLVVGLRVSAIWMYLYEASTDSNALSVSQSRSVLALRFTYFSPVLLKKKHALCVCVGCLLQVSGSPMHWVWH